jgi:HAMP domain-containing protein
MATRTTDDALTALSIRTLETLDDVARWIEQIDLSTVTPEEIQEMRDRLQRLERASARVQQRLDEGLGGGAGE